MFTAQSRLPTQSQAHGRPKLSSECKIETVCPFPLHHTRAVGFPQGLALGT